MFDVIIVGAGAAGAVIASRVSENPRLRVLLIEAGPDYAPEEWPQDLRDGHQNSMRAHDWGYRMAPSPLQRIVFDYPRGRVVGGSTAVNTCVALRGEPEDFDEWAARGLPQWSWQQCLPAFVRLEHDLDFTDAWHGNDGPLPIRRHPRGEWTPWQAAFVDATLRSGFAWAPDSNRPGALGVGPHAMNKVDGERVNVAQAYLGADVRARENFVLMPNTLARRVIVERGRAVALEAQVQGQIVRFSAPTIVLSLGAISTPGLLLRSGIGPEDSVLRIGAPLVRHVPGVGARVLEHPGAAIFFRPRKRLVRRHDPLLQTVLRTGNIQLQPGSKVPFPRFTVPLVSLMCHVRKPRGVGRIVFTSADPAASPMLAFDALEHPGDRADMLAAMQLADRIASDAQMAALAVPFFPSPRVRNDALAYERWLRQWCGTGYHPCGTVPMGADDDPLAVCDGQGRVRGIAGLRVADASLMPTIPSSNINLATIMIGERFGAWLRDGA